MPVDPKASIEITAFNAVPDFAKGLVRDFRVRWALEEAGLSYRERLFHGGEPRPESYLREQPFGQVPSFNDGEVAMFETGAIVLHVGQDCEALLPRDRLGRARASSWVLAALNSVEPSISALIDIDVFNPGADWGRERRPAAEAFVLDRLGKLSRWLGTRDHLEDRFTAGDLMMTTVLRILRHTDLVSRHDNLARHQARCEERPAFRRALDAHLAAFEAPGPDQAV